MKYTLNDRLLKRELGNSLRGRYSHLGESELEGSLNGHFSKIRGIYGDTQWIQDLDIVNELDGHNGCVNALSWSKSGKLLASGSDDVYVNIHSYQPEDSSKQFSLKTAISTGHTANIFSVKFMPHSNDRTLVTAAGDAQVRIFDIEYSGRTGAQYSNPTVATSRRRRARRHDVEGVQYLSEGDTNAKVYQSHSDRVKRIVTESSPHLFLTCSEDGEVRQWDLRQPSSAYPRPRNGRGFSRSDSADDVPPPLISYKSYELDLNTISCSPSQPHYIALGGNHLHCFLHDRRMLGRDRLRERALGTPSASSRSDHDDDVLGQATQCVRKFAPNGQQRMKSTTSGHITACKISDANPNEIVVSWSGDWIYSFDLVRSPDATEEAQGQKNDVSGTRKTKESRDRKRKRKPGSSKSINSVEGAARAGSRARIQGAVGEEEYTPLALRVQYGNGQSEDISIESPRARSPATEARESLLPTAQRESFRLARGTVDLRKSIFTLGDAKEPSNSDPTGHAKSFSSALGHAASLLPDMDEIMMAWRYPVNPHDSDVHFQRTLRRNRASAWRLTQAVGVISRVLGGRLQVASGDQSLAFQHFSQIRTAPGEGDVINQREQFGYDFIKAIMLWLESGVGGLLRGFCVTESPAWSYSRKSGIRYPVTENATADAIDETLLPYLSALAERRPIIDPNASRFEVDENRVLFESEGEAVTAFARAVRIPFADLSSNASSDTDVQDRNTAIQFWGLKVARGVLMNAAEGVNFSFVDRAFGGLGRPDIGIREDERGLQLMGENIDPDAPDPVVESLEVTMAPPSEPSANGRADGEPTKNNEAETGEEHTGGSSSNISDPQSMQINEEHEEAVDDGDEVEDEDVSDDNNDSDNEDDEGEEEEDGGLATMLANGPFLRRSAYKRTLRHNVEREVPCVPHMRKYTGHCNVRTVKDVNFFGLQDEYIVSGSDSGHIFIWDKKTSRIVNILEGDGEVVNVIQGHPYEPMLAVSGIDHSIKIFSPDANARAKACRGLGGVSASDPSNYSSINDFTRRRSRPSQSAEESSGATSEPAVTSSSAEPLEDDFKDPPIARNGLSSRKRLDKEYEITSQNDVDRQGRNQEFFLTRSMLAQLAAGLRQRQENGGGNGEGENAGLGNGPMVVGGDCNVM
ncbi:MAG: hypothetical protein M1820_007299 [Bogoriella megaspora]|nr:MAG: hypothetical protein M1820_007299 [Bogoriella megaspora]